MSVSDLMRDVFNDMGKCEKTSFVEIIITDEILGIAKKKAEHLGRLNKSIMGGSGNLSGFIGEECVKQYFGISLDTNDNTYDFDIIYNDKRFDVKTKKTTVVPRMNHECSVAAYNTRQDCDYYIFTRVLFENDIPTRLYIMGQMDKIEYYKKARFLRKGEKDGTNDFIVREDCYNMYYYDLKPISDIK